MKTIKDSQQFDYTLQITDKKGAPADVDGVPRWTSSNELVAAVEPSADGKSATVVAGVPGTATIAVSADADLGEGVTEISGAEDVVVTPGGAAVISLLGGDPTEQA